MYNHAHNFCKTRMQDESLILKPLDSQQPLTLGLRVSQISSFVDSWVPVGGGGKKASLLHDVERERIQGISIWTYSVSSSFSTDFYSSIMSRSASHRLKSTVYQKVYCNATKSFMPSALCQVQRKLVSGGVIEFESIVSKRPFKRDAERAAHTHVRRTWSDTGFDCKWLEHVGASM